MDNHFPVLLDEVIETLVTDIDGIYVDCTLGFAGHSAAILEKISKSASCSKILIQKVSEITTKDYVGDFVFDNPLSERDKEILNHISMGKSNKEIANQVGLAEQTIKNTISVILDKTFTSNRAQAASMATKNRWI